MSVYPPYTALLLRPLAWFTPQVGQILFTLFHLLALAASLHILAKINPSLSAVKNALIPLSLCFAPLFCGVIGAQNTALSMLLYSLVLFGLFKGDSKGEWLAGLSLGTWLFKPQLGVFAIALAFFLRRPRIIFAASLVTVFYYLLGWLATNATWPLLWIRVSSDFAEQNLWANAPQMVSFVGSLKIFVKALGFEASSSAVAAAGVLGGAALIGVILFYSLRHWQSRSTDSLHTLNAALLLGPTLVITAPQVLFYDLGIALVSLFAVLDFKNDRAFNLFLSLCAVTLPLTYFRDLLPISPFLLIALFILLTVKKEAS